MKKFFITCLLCSAALFSEAVTSVPIFQFRTYMGQMLESQAQTSLSPIRVQGVITQWLPDSTGFFMQSLKGDGDRSTSDGLFVSLQDYRSRSYAQKMKLTPSNLVDLEVTPWYENGVWCVRDPQEIQVLKTQQKLASLPLTFPDDFSNPSQYEGMQIVLNQKMVVNDFDKYASYDEVGLASTRRFTPTERVLPGTSDYTSYVSANAQDLIYYMDDGTHFKAEDGTQRSGQYTTTVEGVFHNNSWGMSLVPSSQAVFQGNERPTTPAWDDKANLKVCTFNVELYMTSNFDSYGPANSTEAERQHQRVAKALLAIDADIYGLCEVQTGQGALQDIVTRLNAVKGAGAYAYVDDNTTTYGTYIKVGFVYRTSKVEPKGTIRKNDSQGSLNRHKAQAFTLKSNNETLIIVENHYKAKSGSGSGDNADSGDGQGLFNGTRVLEAQATLEFAQTCRGLFSDSDVLIMGDLNAHSMEDPIQLIVQGGYTNMVKDTDPDGAYSYRYQGLVGVLDHVLANASMASQIICVKPFHINTDEPRGLAYAYNSSYMGLYRCSDHDPVTVSLDLGNTSAGLDADTDEALTAIQYYQKDLQHLYVYGAKDQDIAIYSLDGRLCMRSPLSNALSLVDVSVLSKGAYVAVLVDQTTGQVSGQTKWIK